MRRALVAVLTLLVAASVHAQGGVGGVGPQAHPWKATKAQFDTYSCTDGGVFEGVIVAVTNAADTTTCPPAGTGTSTATCQCVDGTWTALGGAGGGTDDQTAVEVPYSPTTGTDWTDPDPTEAGGALDTLADRLTVEEAKADDDVPESGDFGAAADLDADGSVSADSVALTTDTTGNYVASVTNGAGITGGDGGSEGAALTIAATLGVSIAAAEMADEDHGDVSWLSGVASVDDEAVAATELADGTAGNLLTWDASGEAAVVSTGTATHVLTSNGAGAAPTFQAAAGGGIGGSTGATDNTILRADGAGGSTLQSSSWSITDAGSLLGGGWTLNSGSGLVSGVLGGPNVRSITSSTSVPTLIPNKSDTTSGLGGAAGAPALIVSNTSRITATSTGATISDVLHLIPTVNAPATCAVGDFYVDTSGAYCACTSTNTWENLTATGACT